MITATTSISQNIQASPEALGNTAPILRSGRNYPNGLFWGNNYGSSEFTGTVTTSTGVTIRSVNFSIDGKYLLSGTLNTNWAGTESVYAYEFSSSGLGATKFQPANFYSSGTSLVVSAVAMSDNNAYVIASTTTSPYIHGWAFSSSGFGTKLSTPATLPIAGSEDIHFSSSATSTYLMCSGVQATSRITYAFNTSTGVFGSTVTQPTMANYAVRSAAFDRTRSYYSLGAASTTPGVYTWPFNSANGTYGTQITTNAPTEQQVYGISFNNQNSVILTSHSNSTVLIKATPWSSGTFGTVYSNPATLPADTVTNLHMNAAQSVVAATIGFAVYGNLFFYDWSTSSGWGSQVTSYVSLPGHDTGGRKTAYKPSYKS